MKPMRPGISLPRLDEYNGAIPEGWIWQVKLNDERGWITPEGELLNRNGRPFARHKEKAFEAALGLVWRAFPSEPVDVALLGFRGGFPVGSIVVLDLPGREGDFRDRTFVSLGGFPAFYPERGESASPGAVHCLDLYLDAKELFSLTLGKPGLEGVIGRRPGVGYSEGDSRDMVKSKWRN